MQVFRAYFQILKKHIGSVLLYAALFVGIIILYSTNQGGNDNLFVSSKVDAFVVNEDEDSSLIRGFTEYLGQFVNFVDLKEGDSVKDALYYGKVKYVLTIPEGFAKEFLSNGEIKLTKLTAPDSIEAVTVDNAIDNYFHMVKVYRSYLPKGVSEEELSFYVQASLGKAADVSFNGKVMDSVSTSNSFNKSFYNYLGYIMIAIFIMSVSTIMFSFNGVDIRRRHTAAPISNRKLNVQLILANFIFVLLFMIIFILTGLYLDKNKVINSNTVLYWLNAVVFAAVALSISYLVGISVGSKKTISAISTALSLGLAFLSGMFVPQELLGAPVLRVASFTPSYWFVKGNNMIENITALKWEEVSGVAGTMLIQLGFAATILSITLVVSKRKRQQAN